MNARHLPSLNGCFRLKVVGHCIRKLSLLNTSFAPQEPEVDFMMADLLNGIKSLAWNDAMRKEVARLLV